MGKLLYQRHRIDVHGIACKSLKSPDASLTQDHVGIALREYVFGGQQPLLNGCREPTLEEYRLASTSNFIKQIIILHIARADLQDIGVLADQIYISGRHDLSHDRETGISSSLRQQLQPW